MDLLILLLLSLSLPSCKGQSMESIPSSPEMKKPGETLSLSCRGSGFSFGCCSMHWIRQPVGKSLEWMGRIWSHGRNTDYSGTLKSRIEITRDNNNNMVYLRLSNLRPEDSATYYCAKENLGTFDYWGDGTKVTVLPDGPDKTPSLFVLSPLQTPDYPLKTADELGPNVCLATDFRPKGDDMVLNVKGGPVNVSTDGAVLSKDNTYYSVAYSNETIHSCGMNGIFGNNEADDECGSIYPEKAKLNFYLLLMNGVRVVFTKALAFSTVLTIRGLLF